MLCSPASSRASLAMSQLDLLSWPEYQQYLDVVKLPRHSRDLKHSWPGHQIQTMAPCLFVVRDKLYLGLLIRYIWERTFPKLHGLFLHRWGDCLNMWWAIRLRWVSFPKYCPQVDQSSSNCISFYWVGVKNNITPSDSLLCLECAARLFFILPSGLVTGAHHGRSLSTEPRSRW